jgi:predicted alpha/beta hydrolase family esterase
MKQAILLHGTGGSETDYFWFEDTRDFLESKNYSVWWPLLPDTDKPVLSKTVDFIEQNMPDIDRETVIIAHSSACPVILHMMEFFQATIKQAILVAGYYKPISDSSKSMLPEDGFDWLNIKKKSEEFIFINSDNDPWGCTADLAKSAAEALSSPLIVNHGEGHMGSGSFDQPYREFNLLKRLII